MPADNLIVSAKKQSTGETLLGVPVIVRDHGTKEQLASGETVTQFSLGGGRYQIDAPVTWQRLSCDIPSQVLWVSNTQGDLPARVEFNYLDVVIGERKRKRKKK